MFQFPGFASRAYGFSAGYRRSGGLPHSETHGSKPARGSPWLIAACCVLRRLSVPRHPPDALQTLDLNFSQMRRAQEKARKGPPRRPSASVKMHHRPNRLPSLAERRTCRVVLGHKFSSHVKDPIPASAGTRVLSRGYSSARSTLVTVRHPALPGGGGRDRTDDLMLAKHALSRLSYAPAGGSGGPGKT